LTTVVRDLREDSLRSLLAGEAFNLAFDGWAFLDKKRNWVLGGWAGGTFLHGNQSAIYRIQRSSIHYFQRPDASHVSLNPEATSLSGLGGKVSLAKQQGHSIVYLSTGILSPGFDPNDTGYQRSISDRINFQAYYGYMWTKPGSVFQQALLIGGLEQNHDFGWNKTFESWLLTLQGVFRNWWTVEASLIYYPEIYSNTLTRGGPLALIPNGYLSQLYLESDSRKQVVIYGSGYYGQTENKQEQWNLSLGLRWKPGPNLNLSFGPAVGKDCNETQWLTSVADPLMAETYGRRYIFGRIDQTLVASELRLNWISPQG